MFVSVVSGCRRVCECREWRSALERPSVCPSVLLLGLNGITGEAVWHCESKEHLGEVCVLRVSEQN